MRMPLVAVIGKLAIALHRMWRDETIGLAVARDGTGRDRIHNPGRVW
jgi:hypothetical protein